MDAVLSIAADGRPLAAEWLDSRILAALDGDGAALEDVLVTVERRVFTLAWRLIGDPSAAEDITQEVLIRVATNLARYRPGSNFNAWVCRITANEVHTFRRRFRRPSGQAEPVAEYDGEREEQLARLEQALATLTPKERDALVLLDIEGYTSREAASILGALSITVRTRAAHARVKVRRHLARYYPELENER